MIKKWYKKAFSDGFQNNLWTLLASMTVSSFNFFILLATVWQVGLAEAGMVSFALAIALLAHSLVIFGVRLFQSTDVCQEFSLHSYLGLRVCSALLTTALMAIFMFVSRFDTTMALVIMLFYLIYLTNGFADVFMGDLQQKGKMYLAGRMQVSAFVLGFVVYVAVAFMANSIIVPLASSAIVIVIVCIAWIWFYRNHFGRIRIKYEVSAIKKLTKEVFPLFLGGFVFTYLFNIQKYYLGFLDTNESVAIISMLIMPITALSLLCTPLFAGAEMTKTADLLAFGQLSELSKRVNRQLLVALAISMFFLFCAYTFGIPLLSLVFGTDLVPYTQEFLIMTLGGAFYPVFAVMLTSMIVMRLQKAYLYSVLAVAVIAAPLLWFVIVRYGIMGAAFANLVIMVPLTVASLVICRIRIKHLATVDLNG
jgi:O-antigen/teichoic acid export membrane protein